MLTPPNPHTPVAAFHYEDALPPYGEYVQAYDRFTSRWVSVVRRQGMPWEAQVVPDGWEDAAGGRSPFFRYPYWNYQPGPPIVEDTGPLPTGTNTTSFDPDDENNRFRNDYH